MENQVNSLGVEKSVGYSFKAYAKDEACVKNGVKDGFENALEKKMEIGELLNFLKNNKNIIGEMFLGLKAEIGKNVEYLGNGLNKKGEINVSGEIISISGNECIEFFRENGESQERKYLIISVLFNNSELGGEENEIQEYRFIFKGENLEKLIKRVKKISEISSTPNKIEQELKKLTKDDFGESEKLYDIKQLQEKINSLGYEEIIEIIGLRKILLDPEIQSVTFGLKEGKIVLFLDLLDTGNIPIIGERLEKILKKLILDL